MDKNKRLVNELKINRTIEALRKNNMEGFLVIQGKSLLTK